MIINWLQEIWCEYEADLHSNKHFLSSVENKTWKNFHAFTTRDLNAWPLRYRFFFLFSGLIFTTAQVVFITAKITLIHVFIRSSHIWFSQSFIHHLTGLFGTNASWLVSSVGQIPYRPKFFSDLIFTTTQAVFIAAKITFTFKSLSTVHIYDFHIFTVKKFGVRSS